MNKTINVNISGLAFTIEIDAYKKLDRYLNSIESLFKNEEGQKEIMDDIESRIAELFKEMLGKNEEVVNLQHVDQLISIMGEAKDYDTTSEEEFESSKSRKSSTFSKKLYRDDDNSVLGGVCAGLGHYFGIDSVWFRLAFILTLIIYGFGILPYIILWIIVPSAKTTAEKLEMKGEAINIDNIGNAIKDEFNAFKKKVNSNSHPNWVNKVEVFIKRVFDLILNILRFAIQFIAKFIAVIIGLIALFLLIGIIPLLLGFEAYKVSIFNMNIDQNWFSIYTDAVFASDFMYYLAIIGIILVVSIPLIAIVYGAIKVLFNLRTKGKYLLIPAIGLWIIGVLIFLFTSFFTFKEFSSEQKYVTTHTIDNITSDTLVVDVLDKENGLVFYDNTLVEKGDSIYISYLKLDVKKSKGRKSKIKFSQYSRGGNRKDAGENAKNIRPIYKIVSNQLKFASNFAIPADDKFRNQKLKITVYIPEGKTIYLTPQSEEIIYDIHNLSNTYDGDMVGQHWKMTNSGLKCLDCSWLKNEESKNQKEIIEEDNETDSIEL